MGSSINIIKVSGIIIPVSNHSSRPRIAYDQNGSCNNTIQSISNNWNQAIHHSFIKPHMGLNGDTLALGGFRVITTASRVPGLLVQSCRFSRSWGLRCYITTDSKLVMALPCTCTVKLVR